MRARSAGQRLRPPSLQRCRADPDLTRYMLHRGALRRQQSSYYPVLIRLSVSSHFPSSMPPDPDPIQAATCLTQGGGERGLASGRVSGGRGITRLHKRSAEGGRPPAKAQPLPEAAGCDPGTRRSRQCGGQAREGRGAGYGTTLTTTPTGCRDPCCQAGGAGTPPGRTSHKSLRPISVSRKHLQRGQFVPQSASMIRARFLQSAQLC